MLMDIKIFFCAALFVLQVENVPLTKLNENYVSRTGKKLIIKPFPAVENYQSDLYEVVMEPYGYGISMNSAIAVFKDCESKIKGDIQFHQTMFDGPILIEGNVTGLPPGKHGMHIHDSGDMRDGCEKLGGHFNPYMLQHGGPMDLMRHVGDLGNVEVAEGAETTEIKFFDPLLSLNGPRSIVGRSLVITEEMDDFGRGGTAESAMNGSAMKPLACAIIALAR